MPLAPRIPHAQHHHGHCHHQEGIERSRVRNIRQLTDREECRPDGHGKTGDDGHDMRRLEPWVHPAQPFGQQPVAAHHEEDARLAENQHQDDRRQREEGCQPDRIAEAGKAQHLEHMGQRFVRTDQRIGILRHRTLARQFGRSRFQRNAHRIHDWLPADGPDRTCGDEDVEDRAEQQRSDQPDWHVALRVLGFLRRGRNRIETDIGEEHGRRGTDCAHPGSPTAEDPGRQERVEMRRFEFRARQRDRHERGQRRNLHDDEDGIDLGAFTRADDQQARHQQRDHQRRKVDEPACGPAQGQRPRAQPGGQMNTQSAQHGPREIARPAYRNRRCGDGVFHDQRPAHRPGEEFAYSRVTVGISRSGDRYHRGNFGIAERGDDADAAGYGEGDHQAGSGLLRPDGGQHENARADNATDAHQGELEPAKRPAQRLLLRCGQNGVERFYSVENHAAYGPPQARRRTTLLRQPDYGN